MQNHIDHIRKCLKIMQPMTACEVDGAKAIEETLKKMEKEIEADEFLRRFADQQKPLDPKCTEALRQVNIFGLVGEGKE